MNLVLSYVSASDLRWSGRLQAWRCPRWLRAWMRFVTRMGDGWLWLAVGLALGVGGPRYRPVVMAAALATLLANLATVVLKRQFRRRRPGAGGAALLRRWAFDQFSFPSGHSLNAFAISTVLGWASPVVAPVLALVAGSIALSRVVLGHHYLGDVLAGSLVGVLVGVLSARVVLG